MERSNVFEEMTTTQTVETSNDLSAPSEEPSEPPNRSGDKPNFDLSFKRLDRMIERRWELIGRLIDLVAASSSPDTSSYHQSQAPFPTSNRAEEGAASLLRRLRAQSTEVRVFSGRDHWDRSIQTLKDLLASFNRRTFLSERTKVVEERSRTRVFEGAEENRLLHFNLMNILYPLPTSSSKPLQPVSTDSYSNLDLKTMNSISQIQRSTFANLIDDSIFDGQLWIAFKTLQAGNQSIQDGLWDPINLSITSSSPFQSIQTPNSTSASFPPIFTLLKHYSKYLKLISVELHQFLDLKSGLQLQMKLDSRNLSPSESRLKFKEAKIIERDTLKRRELKEVMGKGQSDGKQGKEVIFETFEERKLREKLGRRDWIERGKGIGFRDLEECWEIVDSTLKELSKLKEMVTRDQDRLHVQLRSRNHRSSNPIAIPQSDSHPSSKLEINFFDLIKRSHLASFINVAFEFSLVHKQEQERSRNRNRLVNFQDGEITFNPTFGRKGGRRRSTTTDLDDHSEEALESPLSQLGYLLRRLDLDDGHWELIERELKSWLRLRENREQEKRRKEAQVEDEENSEDLGLDLDLVGGWRGSRVVELETEELQVDKKEKELRWAAVEIAKGKTAAERGMGG